jgi:ubiquinone/menaquinone biosynthesis C-methylase UbiE
MSLDRISTGNLQRLYDSLADRYAWFEIFEGQARTLALESLNFDKGQRALHLGLGTGKQHALIEKAISPCGFAIGVDISRSMLHLARRRTAAPLCQADARFLPFASASYDRLYAAYLLELFPVSVQIPILTDFHRILDEDGRMVLLALTEGVDPFSRTLMLAWKQVYRLNSRLCGGCLPVELLKLVKHVGFHQVTRDVVVQMGIPSEIITARR